MNSFNQKSKAWIERNSVQVLDFFGHKNKASKLKIIFRPNHNKNYFAYISGYELTIFPYFWIQFNLSQKREILVHEMCHLVNSIENPNSVAVHGRTWQELMYSAGYEPIVNYSWKNIVL